MSGPSRAWRRQAAGLRLVRAVRGEIPASYTAGGELIPADVAATLAALDRQTAALRAALRPEREMLTTDRLRRQFARQVRAAQRAIAGWWPGQIISAAELANATLLVATDLAAQAPDGARRAAWANIAGCLDYLLTLRGWRDDEAIEAGGAAGEALRRAVWGEATCDLR